MDEPGRARVALVTGASAGIGAAVAMRLAERGFALALTSRREDRLETLAALLRDRHGVETEVIAADLAQPGSSARVVSGTIARFGHLDVLINNAGFGLPGLFADADPGAIRRQVEVNFLAPLLLAREAIPHLIAGRGTIINIGSAITAVATSALGAYGATKAGLAYWNDALRRELRPLGVAVCLVEPGPVTTEFSKAMESLAPPGVPPHPLLGVPAPWMTAGVEDVSRRIVALIGRPKRRLSVRRRLVWPLRLVGGLFQVWPALGDLGVGAFTRHHDRTAERP